MGSNDVFDDDHFDSAAEDFARLLHLIAPVTAAIIGHLPQLESGASVLDLACGTGEPGLTIAREMPEVQVLGIDSAKNMIVSAREAASREGLTNIRFEALRIDDMDVADAAADAVVSRFGALQFGEPEVLARQLARVLKPQAAFSIAVWDDSATNTMFWLAAQAVGRQAEDVLALIGQLDQLAVAGQREQWLRESGLRHVNSEQFHWKYHFASADAAWAMVTSKAMFGSQLERLNAEQLDDVREAFHDALRPFRTGKDAAYDIPQTCRLIWGTK